MRRMTMDEWDRNVAPYLATIGIRAGWIARDAMQIAEWIEQIPAIPDFETDAMDRLKLAKRELQRALNIVNEAIIDYDNKERVK